MQIKTAQLRLARKITNFRAQKHLTQTGLSHSNHMGVSRHTIARIEKLAKNPDFRYDPKLSTLVKIANGLSLSLNQLIGQFNRQGNTQTAVV